MCGITGLIDFRKGSSEDILKNQTDTLIHRGPDGSSQYFISTSLAQIGLGHRRLSIIDLSNNGTQPMHFDGLHIVFNGEVYNYREIRQDLEVLGHQFVTASDTEVLLHSIKEWGYESAIKKWHGMFAVAIYDESLQQLVCIRDRAGVKPFYYYFYKGVFLFGSELKAIICHPAFKREVNRDAVASYLRYGYVSHPHCIWKDSYKLAQGHLLRLDLNTQHITISKYWDVYDAYKLPKLDIPFDEALQQTELVLAKAFQYRMIADVPVGVFLSGGFDSSCVTALLQKNMTEKIRTFTIGTTDPKLNEAPFARQIANHLGTDHTEYYCTIKEAIDIIPSLPYYYDEPFADSSAIPTILVSRLARKNVTVSLSADAGDEIFAGYYRYDYLKKYSSKLNTLPASVRRFVSRSMLKVPAGKFPYINKTPHFYSRYQKLASLIEDPSPAKVMSSLTQVFTDADLILLFSREHRTLRTAHDRTDLLQNKSDMLSYMLAVDYQTYMCDDILQKVDRATMSVGLEGREPFLDQDVIEWAARLPDDYKYRNGTKKHILKEIVYQYIPRQMMDRKKMGFAIPIQDWLQRELKELVHSYFSDAALDAHGFFDKDYVGKMIKSFYGGRYELNLKVWYLLMFQMWYRKWIQEPPAFEIQ